MNKEGCVNFMLHVTCCISSGLTKSNNFDVLYTNGAEGQVRRNRRAGQQRGHRLQERRPRAHGRAGQASSQKTILGIHSQWLSRDGLQPMFISSA